MPIAASEPEIAAFIGRSVSELTDRPADSEALPASAELAALGVDSVLFVNLMIRIEQQYAIFFEDDELVMDHFRTIGQFAGRVMAKLGA